MGTYTRGDSNDGPHGTARRTRCTQAAPPFTAPLAPWALARGARCRGGDMGGEPRSGERVPKSGERVLRASRRIALRKNAPKSSA